MLQERRRRKSASKKMLSERCYRQGASFGCCRKGAIEKMLYRGRRLLYSGMHRRPFRSSVEGRQMLVRLGERSTCHGRELLASGSSSARVGLSAEKDGHSGLQLLLYALELGEMPFSTNQRSELKKCRHTSCRYTCADTISLTWYTNAKPMEKVPSALCRFADLRKNLFTSLVDCGL